MPIVKCQCQDFKICHIALTKFTQYHTLIEQNKTGKSDLEKYLFILQYIVYLKLNIDSTTFA